MSGLSYACRLCHRPLADDLGFLRCFQCRRDYYVDDFRGGLCERITFREYLGDLKNLVARFPAETPQEIAHRIFFGQDFVRATDLALQDCIINMRSLLYKSKTIDVGMNSEQMAFCSKLTDELEKLRKAPRTSKAKVLAVAVDSSLVSKPSILVAKNWLERYKAGEHLVVWEEMMSLGESIRENDYYHFAEAVVYETMRRVRYNTEILYTGLKEVGYDFCFDDRADFEPFQPPTDDDKKSLAMYEKQIGLLPMSIRAFCETVGTVRFSGEHREIDCPYPDPLWMDLLSSLGYEFDEWESDWYEGCDPLLASISLDEKGKAGEYDEPHYQILLPDASVDCFVYNERHETTFVNMLRTCFRWGGFPGFDLEQNEPPPICQKLARGMLEL